MINDIARKGTDKKLAELEKRIATVYRAALYDVQKASADFFNKFNEKDKAKKEDLKNGKITEQEYKQWRLGQINNSKRYDLLEKKLAERMTKANEIALAYVNNDMAYIYALNRNYTEFELEHIYGDLNFTIWDENTVKRLLVDEPNLMPNYPKEKAVQRGIDLAYGKKQIRSTITSGILQGNSIPKIAKDLGERLQDIDQSAAIRAARTAATNAENAGRQDCYKQAAGMGIKVRKRWIASKDGRTRDAHRKLDGQTVDWDKPFNSILGKIRYPGDRTAKPANVYGCRCTMRTVEKEGIEAEERKMRVKDKDGNYVIVNEMTYSEWEKWKNE